MLGTEIDGIAGNSVRDTAGEVLDLDGCDISELEQGLGYLNDNHSNKLPDVLGKITFAKKIYSDKDCEDDRQKYFWNKTKSPFLYFKGRLFDQKGDHRSAKAVAAILQHQFVEKSPLKLKASVEGNIIKRDEKDKSVLKHTALKGIALTFSPANNLTLVESTTVNKSKLSFKDYENVQHYANLIKVEPPFSIPEYDKLIQLKDKLKEEMQKLEKALAIGLGYAGAPSDLVGGGVLQVESLDVKKEDDDEDDNLKFIECPNCGQEQVYLPYQVRCSHCDKSIPFDFLKKLLIGKI